MADLMNIINRLREATSSARKECDIQINKTVNEMTRDLKEKIIKHRDSQIKLIEESSNNSEKELEEIKKDLDENLLEFKNIENELSKLFEHHLSMKNNYEAKINFIANKYKKNRVKQNRINKKELEHLEKQLKKKLIEKMKNCRAMMLKPDETLIKINKMLSEIDIP
ncbi:hypothetical protein TpMuguga_04g02370 [Theileria parva strain Muguga]|uniref:uncharacterized protein n=1 Tax=Theileria parva strain Muguga TaxID=333668 RepID=UPI001C621702|nr:uncharacterized protein TpMuguga_04g02370 [Theileria parva strain Muguga]KAF5153272.1 hypothetical protein TpMuguga_04g02370 [Theileria parva strain Muguga]